MSRSHLILWLLAAGLALLLRCPGLSERPLHNDEAVNAVKFGALWEGHGYKYDPNEHHGPSLYYATLVLGQLTGAPDLDHYTETRLRLVTALFGVGLILLLPLVADGLGRTGVIWAGFFTAVSPAFVFYSRYFIHEMLLVFFSFLALAAGWRYWRTRRIGWVLLFGAALGLMDATKETFVIALAAATLAITLNQTWNRLLDASGSPVKAPRLNPWHLVAALGVWLAVAVVFFSSFFTNAGGPLDSLRSYEPWVRRASADSQHVHPWYFYLQRLLFFHPAKGPLWSEALILVLAVTAALAAFRRTHLAGANASFLRFLTLYTFLLTGFYSLIGYKTPWCALGFWHTTILLAGAGAAVFLDTLPTRIAKFALAFVLLIGTAFLAWQAGRANGEFAADPRNPYVYAQTSPDIFDLVASVKSVAHVSPEGYRTVVKVFAPEDDYWPLPWYLRRFKNIGWWNTLPADPYAPIMILSPRLQFAYDQTKIHLLGFYGLRPREPMALFVENELWQKWSSAQSSSRHE